MNLVMRAEIPAIHGAAIWLRGGARAVLVAAVAVRAVGEAAHHLGLQNPLL